MNSRISYAQNFEDIYLAWLLKDKKTGFYVDVGASHPVKDSVTKYFYDQGWTGVNIEPIKSHFDSLKKQRPRDININKGVAREEGTLIFREYIGGDGLSTFSKKMHQEYEGQREYSEYKVSVSPLSTILKNAKIKDIDFLKVDVEGYEYEVLASNDWSKFRPRVVVVEANHIKTDWHGILKNEGYERVFFDGLNEYFMQSKDINEEIFSYYVPSVIGNPFIRHEERLEYEELTLESMHQSARIDSLENNLKLQSHELWLAHKYSLNAPILFVVKYLTKRITKSSVRKIVKLLKLTESGAKYKDSKALISTDWDKSESVAELLSVAKESDIDNFTYAHESTIRSVIYKTLKKFYRLLVRFIEFLIRIARKIKRKLSNGK